MLSSGYVVVIAHELAYFPRENQECIRVYFVFYSEQTAIVILWKSSEMLILDSLEPVSC